MAEIDDALPNTKTTVEIPGEEEILLEQQEKIEEVETEGGPVEIEMDEDGGAEISFDPKAAAMEGGEEHDSNLSEFLEEGILDPLGSELFDQYTEYKESRGDWEESYREGLDLLGFKYVRRTEPFRGASGVTHRCYSIYPSAVLLLRKSIMMIYWAEPFPNLYPRKIS